MKNTIRHLILLVLMTPCAVYAASFTQEHIQKTMSELGAYDYGEDPTPKHTVTQIIQFVNDKPPLRLFTEEQMIALLQSDTISLAAEQFICQQLWIIGSDASMPVLEKMLRDAKTVEMACHALCTHPSENVNRVLRDALARVPDASKVCIVTLLGNRKDAASVERLIELIGDENVQVAQAAARALGKIGGDQAAEAIRKARNVAEEAMHVVLTEAYLNCAEGYVADKQSARALAIYTALWDSAEPLLTRRATLTGAIHTGDSRAVDLMLAAIRQEDPILRATAIAGSFALPGIEVTRKLVAAGETASPSTKVQLIQALLERNDSIAKDAITTAACSSDVDVRLVAFDALSVRDDAATTKLLCDALDKATTATESDAIMAALQRMPGEQVDEAILDGTMKAAESTKPRLLQVIGTRGYAPAVPKLLELCRDKDATVASAALKTVGTLASHEAMSPLLDLLAMSHDQPDQVLRAITAVIRRSEAQQAKIAKLIHERLDGATAIPTRCALLRLLAVIPNARSLQCLAAAAEEEEPSVRDIAIRTLAKYPDPAAIGVLVQVFQDSEGVHRTLALRGCVRLLEKAETPPLSVYEQLVSHAATPAEKKLLLSGLAKLRHPKARELIEGYLNDETVQVEAELALASIRGETVSWEAVPGEAVPLFDGKSFAGWEGDTVKTWRIEEGAITAGSRQKSAPRNEFLATTRAYGNFDLRLKFKITGNRNVNAGVQIRSKRVPNHHEVSGYQADIGDKVDGHLYDESRRNRMLATPDAEVLKKAQAAVGADGWHTYRIRAEGDRIILWRNGVKTVDYVEKDAGIERTGIIAVQIHGGMRAVIAYKDIEIKELPSE